MSKATRISGRRLVALGFGTCSTFWVLVALAQSKPVAQPVQQAPTARVATTGPSNVSTLARPDLKIVAFDGTKATVKNVSNYDATFSAATPLLAGSSETIPAGGRIAPQQEVTAAVRVVWDCDTVSNPTSAGHYGGQWPATYVARPTDAAGHDMLLVDPTNALAESNENNNAAFPLVRANPLYIPNNAPEKLPDFVVTSPRVWIDGAFVRFEWIDRNQGDAAAQFCTQNPAPSGQTSYIGVLVYRVEIDGKSTGLNSTFISSPWTVQPGQERKAWDFSELETVNQYGVSNHGLPAGCHEFKFIVDPDNRVKESNECNNAYVVYFATGNAACGADKKSGKAPTCATQAPGPPPSGPVPMKPATQKASAAPLR